MYNDVLDISVCGKIEQKVVNTIPKFSPGTADRGLARHKLIYKELTLTETW